MKTESQRHNKKTTLNFHLACNFLIQKKQTNTLQFKYFYYIRTTVIKKIIYERKNINGDRKKQNCLSSNQQNTQQMLKILLKKSICLLRHTNAQKTILKISLYTLQVFSFNNFLYYLFVILFSKQNKIYVF